MALVQSPPSLNSFASLCNLLLVLEQLFMINVVNKNVKIDIIFNTCSLDLIIYHNRQKVPSNKDLYNPHRRDHQ